MITRLVSATSFTIDFHQIAKSTQFARDQIMQNAGRRIVTLTWFDDAIALGEMAWGIV